MVKTVFLLLATVFLLSKIDDVKAGIVTGQGPNGNGEPPCTGPSTGGKTYQFGDTWTWIEKDRPCKCFAHGIADCEMVKNED